eukprot:Sdes_comp20955_c0_seq11m18685
MGSFQSSPRVSYHDPPEEKNTWDPTSFFIRLKEAEAAMELARQRDIFTYYSGFFFSATSYCLVAFYKSRKVPIFLPVIPMSFIYLYQYNVAYGKKPELIRKEAERIMKEELSKIQFPKLIPESNAQS